MSVITALRATPDGRAIRVERDGRKWLRLPVHLVADLGLATGEEMDDARVAAIEDAAALERLWESTLRFTVARGRSEREVRRRLRDRRATDDQAERIMQRLAANGLADEADNARQRVERLSMKAWGSRRIRSEMLGVGFPHDVTAAAIDEALPPDHDAQVLATAVSRGVPDTAKDRRRLADRLVRQGIPPAMVREAIRPDEGTRDEVVRGHPRDDDAVDDTRDGGVPSQAHGERAREGARSVDAEEMTRQIARRYPNHVTDQADRRKALAWLARRGVTYDEAKALLSAD